MTKPTIFIIDDNDMTRTVLRMTIQGDIFDVIGDASNGQIGLENVIKLKPDIVCLDVVMPTCDGLDLLKQIKEALPRVAVLMVTASSDSITVNTAIERGASGFITKPFNSVTVLETLAKTWATVCSQNPTHSD
jgi:two-component system chemotaxis response regulator CheY